MCMVIALTHVKQCLNSIEVEFLRLTVYFFIHLLLRFSLASVITLAWFFPVHSFPFNRGEKFIMSIL